VVKKLVLLTVTLLGAALLVAVPLGARWLYHYEGRAEAREVPRPDLSGIRATTPELVAFADRESELPPGTVLVDRAHDNRFEMAELSVLQARLAARGQRLEPVESSDDLAPQLHDARSLVVISPGTDWTQAEIRQVQAFVNKGGRLLLLTDPTRFDVLYDDLGYFVGLDHDVSHVNDLAATFDLVFQSDYLYNTVENEGNFRNIRLTDLASAPLTVGLKQVVFFAAHSISSQEPALIGAGGETRSSNTERRDRLAVATLAAGGAVLGLGDFTFLTEPYNAVADNDRLISNLADFLGGAQRSYEMSDFPFFFGEEVDLVYSGEPLLDTDLLAGGSTLQALFEKEGKTLALRDQEDKERDTVFLGLYHEAEEAETYLDDAGVTAWITDTETTEAKEGEEKEEPEASEEGDKTPEIAPTEALTVTPPLTVTPSLTLTVPPTATTGVTVTAEVTPAGKSHLEIASFGDLVVTGTQLILLHSSGERQVLLVLSDSEKGLDGAVRRLGDLDLEGCVLRESALPTATLSLALCPSGEVEAGDGRGGWEKPKPDLPRPTAAPALTETKPTTGTVPPPEPPPVSDLSLFIVALDDGEGRYEGRTGAEDFAAILKSRYKVTVWSKEKDGVPSLSDYAGHDLVIWSAGDFEGTFGEDEAAILFPLLSQEVPVIVCGAYVDETTSTAVQRDLKVSDPEHPMTKGFEKDEVIAFVTGPAGGSYEVGVLEADAGEEGTLIPFVRGPDSEEAGAPAILAVSDPLTGMRLVLIGFPIYLLPEQAKERIVLNTVSWLLEP